MLHTYTNLTHPAEIGQANRADTTHKSIPYKQTIITKLKPDIYYTPMCPYSGNLLFDMAM